MASATGDLEEPKYDAHMCARREAWPPLGDVYNHDAPGIPIVIGSVGR